MAVSERSSQEPADIALLLEGTYPYVRGGVSSWVHTMICGLPDMTFDLIFLGGSRDQYDEMKYELPENVVGIQEHFMLESCAGSVIQRGHQRRADRRKRKKTFKALEDLHDRLRDETGMATNHLRTLSELLFQEEGIDREAFLTSPLAWSQICRHYERFSTEPSFVDYFWTVRTIHEPLFVLADVARNAPPARIYHSISTGYAGYLGMMISQLTGRPFVLTEHGIYTKERKIDLSQANWIQESRETLERSLNVQVNYIRQLWIRFFESIGRITYSSAFPITSLYEGNRDRQVSDGADASRTRVVPNGIDLDRFKALRSQRPEHVPPILGLIGRVVPIKDIKTFIRAMRSVVTRVPEAEGWIIGPEEEDPDYSRECRDLVASLGLEGRVKFLGFQNVADILPQLGLSILTSISEALPLVILEGYASGLPCVTTDVGACRELVEGNSAEDRALGAAGAVVPIADPEATATSAVELLTDETKWRAAQRAGIERVETYYTLDLMLDTYRGVYAEALEREPWPVSVSS